MYRGSAPFSVYAQDIDEIRLHGHTLLARPAEMKDPMWHVLKKCWSLSPGERPTMDAVIAKLNVTV
jgi:hypothetical protein